MNCSATLNRKECTNERHLIDLRIYRVSTGEPYSITAIEPTLKDAMDSVVEALAEVDLIGHPSMATLLDMFQLRTIQTLPRTIRIGGYNPIDLIYLKL